MSPEVGQALRDLQSRIQQAAETHAQLVAGYAEVEERVRQAVDGLERLDERLSAIEAWFQRIEREVLS